MSKMYYQGETMPQRVEVRDTTKALLDPDTIVITIIDPEGNVKINGASMTKASTGKYQYDYLIGVDALKGKWTTEIKAEKGFIQIEQDEFTVMEAV